MLLALAFPVAAELPSKELLDSRADELGTSNSSSRRARQVLSGKFQGRFPYPTLVVGLEKARQDRIRTAGPGDGFRSPREIALLRRLEIDRKAACGGESPTPLQKRLCKLAGDRLAKAEHYFDEGKRAFVSHVVSWQTPNADGSLPYGTPEVVYSAYGDCAGGQASAAGFDCGRSPYDNGWAALESLERRVEDLLSLAEPRFTHLLLLANGWNTTQGTSLERTGETARLIGVHANSDDREFRPLVIVVTWHSGWSWRLSEVRFLKILPMVASYGNKAKDADEIGLTWANELLNRHLLPVADHSGIPVVMIGHSFGARMLTRAAASGHLIDSPPDEERASLLVALQGAFSLNRFLPERCPAKEGAPYSSLTTRVTRVVATWSTEDNTNPLAQLASGANHAGGRPAFRRARAYEGRFDLKQWDPHSGLSQPRLPPAAPGERCPCDFAPPAAPLVELIDASSIVERHGDVGDDQMAALLWALIRDTGGAPPSSEPTRRSAPVP